MTRRRMHREDVIELIQSAVALAALVAMIVVGAAFAFVADIEHEAQHAAPEMEEEWNTTKSR